MAAIPDSDAFARLRVGSASPPAQPGACHARRRRQVAATGIRRATPAFAPVGASNHADDPAKPHTSAALGSPSRPHDGRNAASLERRGDCPAGDIRFVDAQFGIIGYRDIQCVGNGRYVNPSEPATSRNGKMPRPATSPSLSSTRRGRRLYRLRASRASHASHASHALRFRLRTQRAKGRAHRRDRGRLSPSSASLPVHDLRQTLVILAAALSLAFGVVTNLMRRSSADAATSATATPPTSTKP